MSNQTKNSSPETWGVTHVLLIMEEVLLSEVHDMEKLVEVGIGGYEGSEYFGCHN